MKFSPREYEWLQKLASEKTEFVVCLDPVSYDTVFMREGSESRIEFQEPDLVQLEDSVMIHNHPGPFGVGMSPADVVLAVLGNVERLHIVSVDDNYRPGFTYVYSMYRPSPGWLMTGGEANTRMEEIWGDVVKEFSAKVENLTLNKDLAKHLHNHEVMKRFSKEMGVGYTRVRLS